MQVVIKLYLATLDIRCNNSDNSAMIPLILYCGAGMIHGLALNKGIPSLLKVGMLQCRQEKAM